MHRLELRTQDIQKAINLYDGCSGNMMPPEKFGELVACFTDKQVDFPSMMEQRILSRHLNMMVMDIQGGAREVEAEAVRQFLDPISPFAKKREDTEAAGDLREDARARTAPSRSAPPCSHWLRC